MWADDEFRDLSALAQWLYIHLLTAPSLTFAGVCDWRPNRIAAHAAALPPNAVEAAADELEAGAFILIDHETEEVLIRSFVKHDGLLRSPNVTKAMVAAHGATASPMLRAVLVDQLKALKRRQPDLRGWEAVGTLLRKRSQPFAEALAERGPSPSGSPS